MILQLAQMTLDPISVPIPQVQGPCERCVSRSYHCWVSGEAATGNLVAFGSTQGHGHRTPEVGEGKGSCVA